MTRPHLCRCIACNHGAAIDLRRLPTGTRIDRSTRLPSKVPGGGSDVFMRALADEMGPEVGGTVVLFRNERTL